MEELTTGHNTNQPLLRPQGFGGQTTIPPPPSTPDIAVRTMASDTASAAQSGGAAPEPQFVKFPTVDPIAQTTAKPMELPPPERSGSSKAILWLFALVVILAAAWSVYTYVIPAYRTWQAAQASALAVQQPTPTPAPVPAAPAISFFGTTNVASIAIEMTPTSIIAALAGAINTKPASVDIQELSFKGATGALTVSQLLSVLLPETQQQGAVAEITNQLMPDLTAYIFYDDNGAWPGYVMKINPASGTNIVSLTDSLQAIELMQYANFFVSPPGTAEKFRTGQVKEKYINRFAPFSQEGASFNYGIFGDYVIVNTSYGGLLKALDLLKL